MTERDAAADKAPEAASMDLVSRALRAIEWLLSAHMTIAQREAKKDIARLLSAVWLAGVAIVLAATALVLVHAAAVVVLQAQTGLSWPAVLLAVAGADVLAAGLFLMRCRARLAPPVMVETRAIARKAAAALTGR